MGCQNFSEGLIIYNWNSKKFGQRRSINKERISWVIWSNKKFIFEED